jgi:aminomethyltransferase
MVGFGGWEMPVEYSGLIAEHLAVRKAAGLFDVSHMGEIEIEGPGALGFLQRVTCNDVSRLEQGQAQYSALPMPNGAPVDDVVLLRRGPERFLLVANAPNVAKDFEWLKSQGPEGCEVRDLSDVFGLLALQGPKAQEILQPLTDVPLSDVAFYRFAEGEVDGCKVILSRTGYTGEDGFELFIAPEVSSGLWHRLLDVGSEHGLVPVGLGARDTLRLEAKMCLYGNELNEDTTLIEAGLGWIVKLDADKGDFVGREVLERQKAEGAPRRLVGFEMVGRGIARSGYPVYVDDQLSGSVTSGTYAPFLEKNIGLCYVPSARAKPGTEIDVEIRGRRVRARLVPTPFYKRPR